MFEEEVEVTLAETGSPFHSSQVRSLLIFKYLVLESFHNQCIVNIFCSWFSCCFTHTFAHFLAKHTFEISTTSQHCAHFENDGLGFYLGKTLLTTKAPGGRLLCHADSLWCFTSSLRANPSLISMYAKTFLWVYKYDVTSSTVVPFLSTTFLNLVSRTGRDRL